MKVLQYYDYRLMNSDLVASRIGRIRDLTRVCNELRAKQKREPLSFDAVTRLMRGDSHNADVAHTIAEVFKKTEKDYRIAEAPPYKTSGRKPRGGPPRTRPARRPVRGRGKRKGKAATR